MSSKRILIVEDDKSMARLVSYNLEKEGYATAIVRTGEDALETLKRESFDLLILDIMLPNLDGFEVCRRIRQGGAFEHLAILMLTARDEEVDRIVGFELGADDYVVKPFSARELSLRIKAILKSRKPKEVSTTVLQSGPLTVDVPRHRVTIKDREVSLTPMEFNLLVMLMQRRGYVQTRESLLQEVWDIRENITTRTINTHVTRLRAKLGMAGRKIETVRGVGYRFSESR